MRSSAVIERAESIAAVRAEGDADRSALVRPLEAERELRAWLDSSAADLADRLRHCDPFATSTMAAASRRSSSAANTTLGRAATLAAVPELAGALGGGRLTAGHVDAVTRAAKRLEDEQRCKLHHVVWWRHGGRTDLENLLPVCVHHHGRIHNDDWHVKLGPNRELSITLPDGTKRSTGPPSRTGP